MGGPPKVYLQDAWVIYCSQGFRVGGFRLQGPYTQRGMDHPVAAAFGIPIADPKGPRTQIIGF